MYINDLDQAHILKSYNIVPNFEVFSIKAAIFTVNQLSTPSLCQLSRENKQMYHKLKQILRQSTYDTEDQRLCFRGILKPENCLYKQKPGHTNGVVVIGHYRALDMFTIFLSPILLAMPSSCLRCYSCSTTTYDRFKKVQQLIFAKITPPIHKNKHSLFLGEYNI